MSATVSNSTASSPALSAPSRPKAHPLARFVARRVAAGVATLLVATILIFAAVQLLPGNVATVVLGRSATPALVSQVKSELHLNQPVPERYVSFIENFVTGHFGDSDAALAAGQKVSVWSLIRTPLRNSLVLALLTLALFVPLSLFFGTVSALCVGRKSDHAISSFFLFFGAMPEFLVGTLLIFLFFTEFHLLPAVSPVNPGQTPFSNPNELVLPVLTLLVAGLAVGVRLVRASVIEVLNQDYVSAARLNGVRERRVIMRYALRNALAPAVQILGQELQYLIGGIIVVEAVFDYPGIGTALVGAVSVRDIQEVTIVATLIAALYVLINIVTDLLVVLLVPKLRTSV
jgi:peptide/nickel transport system permease protein